MSAVEVMFPLLLSFGAFAVFVWVARCAVASPSFRPDSSALTRLVHACVAERPAHAKRCQALSQKEQPGAAGAQAPDSFATDAGRLALCTAGIQVSYLVWGLMQERIMTRKYSSGDLFTSSKFLVFANRFLALLVAYAGVLVSRRQLGPSSTDHSAPLYKFSFSSISNIVSSVSQYEALKFVSFPTQVVAKSCKMVPVMLMGYLVSGKRYTALEYGMAVAITSGAAIFKLNEDADPDQDKGSTTELIGIVLIVCYMGADSFTSNWQSKIFKQYGVSSMVMMMYANLFSSGFTALGLLLNLEIVAVARFVNLNPEVALHIGMMAVCSAVGQLFIFYTIKRYGPLVFATIQTVRQLLSIVLSILFFGHPINLAESAGIGLVFVTLAYQIYAKYKASKQAQLEKAQQQKERTPVPLLPAALGDEPADGSENDLDTEHGISSCTTDNTPEHRC